MNIPGFTVEDRGNSKVVKFPSTDLAVGVGIQLVGNTGNTSVHTLKLLLQILLAVKHTFNIE